MHDYAKSQRLDGKVALVTGGGGGIGAESARALAQMGAAVLVTDISEAAGKATADGINKAGGRAAFFKHDVTKEAQWEAAVAEVIKQFGGYDILLNNAGIETAAFISQCTNEDFSQVMNVNVNGVFLGLKHAVRAMSPGGPAGKGGSIINLSSVAGLIGTTGHIAYHTSKGAVRLMSKAAAVECAQLGTGIRVNSLHPAIVRTEMGDNFMKHFVDLGLAPDVATAEAAVGAGHLLGFGKPPDVASAVVFLASEASRWMTGTELVIDGGYTAV